MKNVIIFIWRYYFFFLYLIVQSFSVWLLIDNNSYHSAGYYSTLSEYSHSVKDAYNNFFEYFRLKEVNAQLAAENARLRQEQKDAFFQYKKSDQFTINDTVFRQQYIYMPAKVISSTTGLRNNFITIDRGTTHGIEPDMAVINSEGVVGVVKDVSPNFASIISLLNNKSSISAKLKNTEYFGSCVWEGGSAKYAKLKDIPSHAEVHIGDTVISSSYSRIFPAGVPVGIVHKVNLNPGNNFYDIDISLSTNFHKIGYVYVVKNLMKVEQENLETISRTEN